MHHLDASRTFEAAGGTLTPSLDVGLRHDGGDADTGTGVEVCAGLRCEGDSIAVEGSALGLAGSDAQTWRAGARWQVAPAGHGFDQPPNEAAGVESTRRLRLSAGRRGKRLCGGQEGLRKRQVASFEPFTLRYELWYDLCNSLFLMDKWRRGRDSNPRWAFNPYSLSRGAPSATRPPLRDGRRIPKGVLARKKQSRGLGASAR